MSPIGTTNLYNVQKLHAKNETVVKPLCTDTK